MTDHRRESAQIFQFPVRGRAAFEGLRMTRDRGVAANEGQRLPVIECGSGWYHQAAVQDATLLTKR